MAIPCLEKQHLETWQVFCRWQGQPYGMWPEFPCDSADPFCTHRSCYLRPSPDLCIVADTLAGSPITEPGALHACPFCLSVITADNTTPVWSADPPSAFHQLVVQWRPIIFLLIWRVSIKENKMKSQHIYRSGFMANWKWYPSILWLFFFGNSGRGLVKEFPHIT